jgi:hypothetical protein
MRKPKTTLLRVVPKPHLVLRKRDEVLEAQWAAGPCPHCGRVDHWLNDVPLSAFCNGTEAKPHREWQRRVPVPFNPYLPGLDPKARAKRVRTTGPLICRRIKHLSKL